MAIDTGDLTPRASGSASLGVEQMGLCGFTTDIRPFCHTHMNSGVFHSPLHGNSGVVRYSEGRLELSDDGGISFRRFVRSLQDAYNGGNKILLQGTTLADVTPGADGFISLPLIIQEPLGAHLIDEDDDRFSQGHAGIAVSGTSVDPNNPNSFGVSRLSQQALFIQASGLPSAPGANLFMGFGNPGGGGNSPSVALIETSGGLNVRADGNISIVSAADSSVDSITLGAPIASFGFGQTINDIGTLSSAGFMTYSAGNSMFHTAARQLQLSAWGGSGLLSYQFGPHESWHTTNGAGDTTLIPIPHSGHVEQMITALAGGSTSLQDAYDNGKDIDIVAINGNALGVSINEPPIRVGNFVDHEDPFAGHLNYGLAVSGSPNPDAPLSTSLARVGSQFIHIRNSGFFGNPGEAMFIGYEDAGGQATLQSSGSFTFEMNQSVVFNALNGNMDWNIGSNVTWDANGFIAITGQTAMDFATNGNYTLLAGQQTNIQPWFGSGSLTYLFGPYEAWHTTNGAGDLTPVPIPHSGHVERMIADALPVDPTMQSVYEENPLRVLNDGNMLSISATAKHVFGTFGDRAEIQMSGITDATPSTDMERGDLSMLYHAQIDRDPGQTTAAGLDAIAAGLGTLALNTGSGIANVMVGSGIQRWRQAGSTVASTFPTFTAVALNTQIHQNDKYYSYDASNTGIRVFTPGLYMVFGAIQFQSIGATDTVVAQMTVNGTAQNGTAGSAAVIANGFASVYPNGLLNLDAGDIVRLQISRLGSTNTIQTLTAETAFNIVYLGPKRAGGA